MTDPSVEPDNTAAPRRHTPPPAAAGKELEAGPTVLHGLPASETVPDDSPTGRQVDDVPLAANPAPTGTDPARVNRPLPGHGEGRTGTRPPPIEKDC